METKARRGGIVGPLILIGLGVLFLLNNLGVVSWNVWLALWQLWPLLLIAIGLDILIGRRSLVGSLVVVVVTLLLFAGGVWYLSAQSPGGALTPTAITQPVDKADQGDIRIDVGLGKLELGATTSPDILLEGTIELRPGERLQESRTEEDGKVIYSLSTVGTSRIPMLGSASQPLWDLRLNDEIPLKLDVNAGMGTADLKLARLNLIRLDVNAGVGDVTVTLPRHGRFSARIDGGVGRLTVLIPATMAARVEADTGIGGIQVDNAFTESEDNVYTTRNYGQIDDQVDVEISGGVGQITVRQAPAE